MCPAVKCVPLAHAPSYVFLYIGTPPRVLLDMKSALLLWSLQNHGLDTHKEALADERFPRNSSASALDSSSSMFLEDPEPYPQAEEASTSG